MSSDPIGVFGCVFIFYTLHELFLLDSVSRVVTRELPADARRRQGRARRGEPPEVTQVCVLRRAGGRLRLAQGELQSCHTVDQLAARAQRREREHDW